MCGCIVHSKCGQWRVWTDSLGESTVAATTEQESLNNNKCRMSSGVKHNIYFFIAD